MGWDFPLRQFFAEIPRDLIEAARIDGCSHLSVFRRIVLPNAVPAMITFALIAFKPVGTLSSGP